MKILPLKNDEFVGGDKGRSVGNCLPCGELHLHGKHNERYRRDWLPAIRCRRWCCRLRLTVWCYSSCWLPWLVWEPAFAMDTLPTKNSMPRPKMLDLYRARWVSIHGRWGGWSIGYRCRGFPVLPERDSHPELADHTDNVIQVSIILDTKFSILNAEFIILNSNSSWYRCVDFDGPCEGSFHDALDQQQGDLTVSFT